MDEEDATLLEFTEEELAFEEESHAHPLPPHPMTMTSLDVGRNARAASVCEPGQDGVIHGTHTAVGLTDDEEEDEEDEDEEEDSGVVEQPPMIVVTREEPARVRKAKKMFGKQ